MPIERLALTHYRNLLDVSLELGSGFTVLVGRNGAGKTNVVEAIYLLSTLRSFRLNSLGPLIHRDHAQARVELTLRGQQTDRLTTRLTVRLERQVNTTRRVASIDDKIQRSAEAFYGRVPTILFTPEDLNVLRGSPAGRRQLLDRALFARTRVHITDVRNYEKIVRSRNQVLKQRRSGDPAIELLDTYDEQLAELGARIWTRRSELLDQLRPQIEQAFTQIHGMGDCSISYVSRVDPCEPELRQAQLLDRLRARREEDTLRGATGVGPHHDDFAAKLEGRPVAEFASQGQTRAIILALKVAELRSARTIHGTSPLLLLDDVSSELDPERSAQFFELLRDEVEQCIVTTTAGGYLPPMHAHVRVDYAVDTGRITRLPDG